MQENRAECERRTGMWRRGQGLQHPPMPKVFMGISGARRTGVARPRDSFHTAEILYKPLGTKSLAVNVLTQGKPARKPGAQRLEATARDARFKSPLCLSACQYSRAFMAPSKRCVDTPYRLTNGGMGWVGPSGTCSRTAGCLVCCSPAQVESGGPQIESLGETVPSPELPHARRLRWRGEA
jgi:hypothetical protein